MYADLAEFQPVQAATQSAGAPKKSQSTDYASITDIMQEREGGSFKKVPINTPAADPDPPQRPKDEKPVKEDAEKEKNSTETGDEKDNLLARKGDGDNVSKSSGGADSRL